MILLGVIRVREAATGFAVITGFYAILAGLIAAGAGVFA